MKNDPLEMDSETKKVCIEKIQNYLEEELDEEVGTLKAGFFLDFIQEHIGREYYNKGINAARFFFRKKMEDLEIDLDQLLQ